MTKVVASCVSNPRPDRVEADSCCHPACEAPPIPDAPLPICGRHIAQVIRYYQARLNAHPELAVQVASDVIREQPKPAGRPCVYFIRFGERVKIGFSANVRQRLKALPRDAILKVIPGTPRDERLWHAQWSHLRVTGEWFDLTPELRQAIAAA